MQTGGSPTGELEFGQGYLLEQHLYGETAPPQMIIEDAGFEDAAYVRLPGLTTECSANGETFYRKLRARDIDSARKRWISGAPSIMMDYALFKLS